MTSQNRLACRAICFVGLAASPGVWATDFGFCVTPAGTYGVIPCDLGCSGAAMADKASSLVSTYADYTSKMVKVSGTLAQCVASETSGAMKYQRAISSQSNAITKKIADHRDSFTDNVSGAAVSISGVSKPYLELIKRLGLALQNQISFLSRVFLKTLMAKEEEDRTITPSGTTAIIENIVDTRQFISNTLERQEQNRKHAYFETIAEAKSRVGNRQEMRATQDSLIINRASWIWEDYGTILNDSPKQIYKLSSSTASNNELLAAYLSQLNSNNAERFVMVGAFK